MMERTKARSGIAAATAVMIVVVYGALAEEKQSRTAANPDKGKAGTIRQIVISIPDCNPALVEDGLVLKVWRTAVGAKSTPSPSGTYTIINRVSQPRSAKKFE